MSDMSELYASEVKLFNKWSTDEIEVNDITLVDYIPVKGKHATYEPHTAGRYQAKKFRKTQCPIVERLCNALMMHGRNTGKKMMTVRIVRHTFELIHLLTKKNPLQVFVQAVQNGGPREDSTRIGSAGVVRRQVRGAGCVDVCCNSPLVPFTCLYSTYPLCEFLCVSSSLPRRPSMCPPSGG
jgi:small subunit ribosomal protein S5e